MVEIKLSPADVSLAVNEGTSRYNYNRSQGNDPTKSAAPTWVEALAREVSGILGEIAVARWLDKFPFSLFENRKRGDVGGFEVRTTAHATGKLLLNEDDNPESTYILVTLPTHYTANIVGWMRGYEAQEPKFWEPSFRIPCYAVPQQFLHAPQGING